MNTYTVGMIRHFISYRTASATVDAEDEHEAAKLAQKMDLEWLEDDTLDEGPVDYEVSSANAPTLSWRAD